MAEFSFSQSARDDATDLALHAKFPTLDSELVCRVSAKTLYSLHYGRNSPYWWVKVFDEHGCIHQSLAAAKASAERARVQGSVFYISELPAVVFESPRLTLAVTELDHDDVLRGYAAKAVRNSAHGAVRIHPFRDNYFERGSSLIGALLSFESDSRFWRAHPSDRIIYKYVTDSPLTAYERILSGRPRRYKSSSIGGAYPLRWHESPSGVKARYVKALLRSSDCLVA